MARTVRKVWMDAEEVGRDGFAKGVVLGEHRDGKTGWVVSRRLDERSAKRTARQDARREAWAEAALVGALAADQAAKDAEARRVADAWAELLDI